MTRRPGWQGLLSIYLEREAGRPFVWGSDDCALFAAGAVAQVTGEDPAGDLRGEYDGAHGAYMMLKRAGHDSLEGILTERLGPPIEAVPEGGPERGDVVLWRAPTVDVVPEAAAFDGVLGVSTGGSVAFKMQPSGLLLKPWQVIAADCAAWKV